MCGHRQPPFKAETERQRLAKAIERLEARKWCDDATVALDAARKHLATLPPDREYRVRHSGLPTLVALEFSTRSEAEEYAKHLISCGATSVSIEKM